MFKLKKLERKSNNRIFESINFGFTNTWQPLYSNCTHCQRHHLQSYLAHCCFDPDPAGAFRRLSVLEGPDIERNTIQYNQTLGQHNAGESAQRFNRRSFVEGINTKGQTTLLICLHMVEKKILLHNSFLSIRQTLVRNFNQPPMFKQYIFIGMFLTNEF